jgi:putative methanogenesis marker protein 8
MAEHLLEMAKARVKIEDGRIDVLTDPLIRRCPLREGLYGIENESRDTIEGVLKKHISDLGMYGPGRTLEIDQRPVAFGASEILMDSMAVGLVDAAVTVCEGAGTIVVSKPEVLQAVGAHMTGLIKTDPIGAIQDGLEMRGCLLLDRKGRIDQIKGFELASAAGFKRIAVTVSGSGAEESKALRRFGKAMGNEPIILAVHTTGITESEAGELADSCDIVWSCASRAVREIVGKRARLQLGISIPVFALTKTGRRLILNRALNFDGDLVIHRALLPMLPEDKQPEPLL